MEVQVRLDSATATLTNRLFYYDFQEGCGKENTDVCLIAQGRRRPVGTAFAGGAAAPRQGVPPFAGASGARAGADYDFQGHIQFFAVPELSESGENLRFGLSFFFSCQLFQERAERRGDFGELLPVLVDR